MKQQQVGTIVGSSVHLTGAIKDVSDISIFGSVDGEVTSEEKVIIEESAKVKGPVSGREVIVSGYVNGTISAKERLELNASGVIKGNIETKNLLIHSGATFIGKSSMPEKKVEEGFTPEEEFEAETETEEESPLAAKDEEEDPDKDI